MFFIKVCSISILPVFKPQPSVCTPALCYRVFSDSKALWENDWWKGKKQRTGGHRRPKEQVALCAQHMLGCVPRLLTSSVVSTIFSTEEKYASQRNWVCCLSDRILSWWMERTVVGICENKQSSAMPQTPTENSTDEKQTTVHCLIRKYTLLYSGGFLGFFMPDSPVDSIWLGLLQFQLLHFDFSPHCVK